jgi:hypothetical protein
MGGGGGGGGGSAVVPPRAVTYADLGGVEEVLADIRELIEYPLKHPEVGCQVACMAHRGCMQEMGRYQGPATWTQALQLAVDGGQVHCAPLPCCLVICCIGPLPGTCWHLHACLHLICYLV